MLEETLAGGSMLRDTLSLTQSIHLLLVNTARQSIMAVSEGSLCHPRCEDPVRHMKVKMTGRRGRSIQPWGGDSQQPAVFSSDRSFFNSPKASGSK
jgi:hypothetical protein